MNKKVWSFLLVGFVSFFSVNLLAQRMSDDEILRNLSDVGDVKMNKSDKNSFDAINRSFVKDLDHLMDGKQSKDDKDKGVDRLFDKREKSVESLFFKNHGMYQKYKNQTEKKFNKFKRDLKISLFKTVF